MNGRYEILDGLRGVTAILVVSLHFLEPIDIPGLRIGHARLALDFFLCLSGFVLTHAYGDLLARRLSFRSFYTTRCIRLYPMLLCGLVAGMLVLLAKLVLQGDVATIWNLLGASVANLVMLPSSLFPIGHAQSWPANPPQWALFLQFVVSLAFPWLLRAGDRPLIAVMGLAGVVVVIDALTRPHVPLRDAWAVMPVGLIRVLYPVCVGILLYRLASRLPRRPVESPARCVGLVLMLMAIFFVPMPRALSGLYEAVAVLILLPMLLLHAASIAPAAGLRPLTLWLGAVSYPLYALHYPIVRAVLGALRRFEPLPIWQHGLVVVVAIGACVGLAWVAFKRIDVPVRRWLTRRQAEAGAGLEIGTGDGSGTGGGGTLHHPNPREVLSTQGAGAHEAPRRTLFEEPARSRPRPRHRSWP